MKDKKKLLKAAGVILLVAAYTVLLTILIPLFNPGPIVPIDDEKTPTSSGVITINQSNADLRVIPDKYNTGVNQAIALTKVSPSDTVNGVAFTFDGSQTKNVLDFAYKNTTFSGTVTFDNIDFSAYPFVLQNESLVTRNITLIFNNCKFSNIFSSKADSTISLQFNNCTINSFGGSNATFTRCSFGGTSGDAINPFRNVFITDCYISDMSYALDSGVVHTDGTQIYGAKDLDAYNIHFQNTRFEIPQLVTTTSNAYVNACIMIQLEYSNGVNISFDNCYINGGGYSIYAWAKNTNYSLTNVRLSNINVGGVRKFGQIYQPVSPGVTTENINDTSSLYVASVWKDSAGTHLSVTNDTNVKRTLQVLTDTGEYTFDIPACPTSAEITAGLTFKDFPFDLDKVIPADCKWVVCYDITGGARTQLRFVNWGTEIVTIQPKETASAPVTDTATAPIVTAPSETVSAPVTAPKTIYPITGICGKNVTFSLSEDGTLTLIGTGATYNYSSSNVAPWHKYNTQIKTLIIPEGITSIGSQMFRGCSLLTQVSLPEGMLTISNNAFINCSSLTTLYLPSTMVSIGGYAFWGTALSHVYYNDTELDFYNITKGSYNDPLLKANYSFYNPIIGEGKAGKNVSWSLSGDGVLTLTGTGATSDYSSTTNSPWYNFSPSVKTVIVQEGITILGNQLFRGCSNISSISLPSTLTQIKNNVFIGCSSIKTITLPVSLTSIGSYAFIGTGLTDVKYLGTKEQWAKIKIGSNNTPLTSAKLTTN